MDFSKKGIVPNNQNRKKPVLSQQAGTTVTWMTNEKIVTLNMGMKTVTKDRKQDADMKMQTSSEKLSTLIGRFSSKNWKITGSIIGQREIILSLNSIDSKSSRIVLFRQKQKLPSSFSTPGPTSSIESFFTNPYAFLN